MMMSCISPAVSPMMMSSTSLASVSKISKAVDPPPSSITSAFHTPWMDFCRVTGKGHREHKGQKKPPSFPSLGSLQQSEGAKAEDRDQILVQARKKGFCASTGRQTLPQVTGVMFSQTSPRASPMARSLVPQYFTCPQAMETMHQQLKFRGLEKPLMTLGTMSDPKKYIK